jgi:inhibitor of cysteine peptidase
LTIAQGSVADFVFGERDNGGLVEVPRSSKITIELEENPTTGYRWLLSNIDEVFLVPEGHVFLTGEQAGLGAGGLHQFFFRAKGAGHTTVSLLQKRVWQGDDGAVGSFKLAIRILK